MCAGIIGNVTFGGQLLTHWTAREVNVEQACSDLSNRVTVRGSRAAEALLSLVPLTFPNSGNGNAHSRTSRADKSHSPLQKGRAQHSHPTHASAADTGSEPRQETFLPTFYAGLLSCFRAFVLSARTLFMLQTRLFLYLLKSILVSKLDLIHVIE